MSYECPRCGQAVSRGSSAGAGLAGGLVGVLLYAAFGNFQCMKCGEIPKSEFAPEVQSKMTMGSIGLIVTAIVIFVAVIALIIFIRA